MSSSATSRSSVGGEVHPVLRGEGGVVPLGDRRGVRVPLLDPLELPLHGEGLGGIRRCDGGGVGGEVATRPPCAGINETPPAFAAVLRASSGASSTRPASLSTLRWWLAEPDGLPGAGGEPRGGGRHRRP